MKFKKLLSLIIMLSIVFSASACESKEKSAEKTITNIEIWTYYTGEQKSMFDSMVDEFNKSLGKEKGIVVSHQVQGEPHELDETLLSAVKEDAGSLDAPDMFITYRGIDSKLKKHRELVNFYDYYTEEELAELIDSFVQMGIVQEESGDKLYMFPLAKSQTIVMLNDTDFNDIKDDLGIDYADLETYEKLIDASKKYYEYTDAMTDIPNDGKSLFGVDSVPNFFLLAVKANGNDFLELENGKTVANLPKETARLIWDSYYIPMVKGYFGKEAKYATEDIKIGELLLSSGSTAGTLYFPDQKYINDVGYDIEMKILSIPYYEGKEKLFYTQGGGFFALKGSEETNKACVEFLKWLTSPEVNAKFAINSGYLPVSKKAFNKDFLEKYINENNVAEHTAKTLLAAYEQYDTMTPYAQEPLVGFDSVRRVISEEFGDYVSRDVKEIKERIENGEKYEDIMTTYLSDEHFEIWYDSFMEKVNATLDSVQ